MRLVAGVTDTLQVRIINVKLSLAKINFLMLCMLSCLIFIGMMFPTELQVTNTLQVGIIIKNYH